MDKSKWPKMVLSAEHDSQDLEGMGDLTQEDNIISKKDAHMPTNVEFSSSNIQFDEEDFMDHLSDQSKLSDMENDYQGWQSPKSRKSKKKKRKQVVVATRTSSRVPRDGIPIANKTINRAKAKNNTTGSASSQNPFTALNNADTASLKEVILDIDIEVENVEEQIDIFRVEELARAAIAEANYKAYLEK